MRFAGRWTDPLKHVYQALCLVALLIAGQQGAVVHELGHMLAAQSAELHVSAGESDANCPLCPLFAQVATPAFSPSFSIPLLLRAGIDRVSELTVAAVDGAGPTPRSRGPPLP
jgi:hypothetical protein